MMLFHAVCGGSDRVKPYSVLMAMTNAAASWIGIEYGLSGPNLTYSHRLFLSASGNRRAARRIASGDVDVMIAAAAKRLSISERWWRGMR